MTLEPRDPPRLFDRRELQLRPTGVARLRKLAGTARVDRSAAAVRSTENRRMMRQLREWGTDLASRFGLVYTVLEPERDGVTEHYGICYEDGVIRIRLRHATTGRLLKESSLVDTLCHELAHLRHLNHGLAFQRLYAQILEKARALGYYKPGRPQNGQPRQGSLFDGTGCGTRARGR